MWRKLKRRFLHWLFLRVARDFRLIIYTKQPGVGLGGTDRFLVLQDVNLIYLLLHQELAGPSEFWFRSTEPFLFRFVAHDRKGFPL